MNCSKVGLANMMPWYAGPCWPPPWQNARFWTAVGLLILIVALGIVLYARKTKRTDACVWLLFLAFFCACGSIAPLVDAHAWATGTHSFSWYATRHSWLRFAMLGYIILSGMVLQGTGLTLVHRLSGWRKLVATIAVTVGASVVTSAGAILWLLHTDGSYLGP